jgi:N6-adenosine-specific RNA methylase IME4
MKYEIVYADFPWPYTSFGTAKLPYGHMSEQQIASFDWSKFVDRRCIVFCWATGPKLDVAFRCGEVWRKQYNLHYQGMPYIWVKTTKAGKPIRASGPRPRLVKPLDEFVLAFSTTPKARTFPLLTEAQTQHVFAPKVGRGEHSKKPAVFRELIVELLGDRPRIELFAREVVPGWDGWGDQYPKTKGNRRK